LTSLLKIIGETYIYYLDKTKENSYILLSGGPDGKEGGGDDITQKDCQGSYKPHGCSFPFLDSL